METSDKRQRSPAGRRRSAGIMAVVLTAAILLGGTFAWQNLGDAAINQAAGKTNPAGGRLHDDYEVVGENNGEEEWTDGLTANKDVYVENYEAAPNGRDIFIRLKLYEYMEIGPGATLPPEYEADGVTPAGDYADRAALPLIPGSDREDVSTWSPRVPGVDFASDQFRNK